MKKLINLSLFITYLIILLLIILSTSCSPELTIQSGTVTGSMLVEPDLAMFELQKDGTNGSKKKHFDYFYDKPNTYLLGDHIDSITAEQIYPSKIQLVNN